MKFSPPDVVFILIIAFLLATSQGAHSSTCEDTPIDDFSHVNTNFLGGEILSKDIDFSLGDEMLILKPLSENAEYTNRFSKSGYFNSSKFDLINLIYSAKYDAGFLISLSYFHSAKKTEIVTTFAINSSERMKMNEINIVLGQESKDYASMLFDIKISNFQPIQADSEFHLYKFAFLCPSQTNLEPKNDASYLLSPPSELTQSKGIQNVGTTCYANSLLNAMFLQSTVYDYLLLPMKQTDPKLELLQNWLRKIVNKMRNGILVGSATIERLFVILNENGFETELGTQEDTSELFIFLLDKLGAASIKISKLGQYDDAHDVEYSMESHSYLMLSIPTALSKRSILNLKDDLLEYFFHDMETARRKINNSEIDVNITTVKKIFPFMSPENEHTKFHELISLGADPRYADLEMVVPIQLKRFNNVGAKINTRVSIPFELDMLPYATGPMEFSEDFKMVLTSVIVHLGRTLQSGHYKTYVKGRSSNEWIEMNDDIKPKIRKMDEVAEVLSLHAYILFYEVAERS